jgi:hypothetical protein
VLLERADECERLDALALPHLDPSLSAVKDFDRNFSP